MPYASDRSPRFCLAQSELAQSDLDTLLPEVQVFGKRRPCRVAGAQAARKPSGVSVFPQACRFVRRQS